MLNHILEEKELTKYSYGILVHFKNKEKIKNIFESEKTNKESAVECNCKNNNYF